jgi:hypothetical protein
MPDISTQPQATSSPPSFNWKRVLVIVVIAAVLIGLGVVIFLLLQPKEETTSPTKKATPSAEKDETADWELVENDVLGYSMKYPKEWSVLRCKDSGNDNYHDSETQTSNPEYSKVLAGVDVCASGARTRIVIYQHSDGTYSDKVNSWDKYGPTDYKTYQKTNLSVNGRDAVRVYTVTKTIEHPSVPRGVHLGEGGMQEGVVFIQYVIDAPSNKALIVDYIQGPGNELNPPQPDYSDILEKMVSTLKFLD